ncbi:hypothetical protein [Leptospira kirschneri]|uniref:Uncharacterized protein n=3 Tax=Leptospira kirschneri TaxID=29507 RepID=A0A1T1E180_9LEPT|nr:hypothetical protein [Leptospira kirschneri]EKO14830.1 hypothetical protein LEP1GSC081_1497 [Leptospira kirschneri str. H1]EKO61111.1 hypothetical protein LEP1GSC082_2956 [Leptospira kirschneri str. H2]EMJ94991.1 hypothetical protein LEP1GSC198_1915 [Leptospira kirschneri str. JB]EMK26185.1 hypothetical protein LEP1GSC008_0940 [Leptospira kirschneri serovar Bulgarica str. Nikolaevo]OOV46857.1 hypothetical protein B1J93_02690 [Leptospira kirschneri serovar Pomona]
MYKLFNNFEIKKRGLRISLFFTIVSLISFFIGNTILQFILLGLGLVSFVFTLVQPETFYFFTNLILEWILIFFSGILKVGLLIVYMILWKPIQVLINLFRGEKNS